MSVASCPRLRFTAEKSPRGMFVVTAYPVRRPGQRTLQPPAGVVKAFPLDHPAMSVGFIEVNPDLRRCGVGTALYTKLAKFLCQQGRVLESDRTRTDAAEMFWRKQHAKGRAECIEGRGQRIRYDDERGFLAPIPSETWPCYAYRLSCPVTSLAGRKR